MLLVKTRLDKSKIEGIGLFADEFIPKGTTVWELNDLIDLSLSETSLKELSPPAREQILKYSYLDKRNHRYVLCGDDARFFNHSDTPNCIDEMNGPNGGRTVSLRDIEPGEELTCDYSVFDDEHAAEVLKSERKNRG
jgi:SET domain-containing protein